MRNEIVLRPRRGIERTGITLSDRMAQGYAFRHAGVFHPNGEEVAEISWLTKRLEDGAVQSICRLSVASPIFGPCEELTRMTVSADSYAADTDAEIEALCSCAGKCGVFFSARLGLAGFTTALEAQMGLSHGALTVYDCGENQELVVKREA